MGVSYEFWILAVMIMILLSQWCWICNLQERLEQKKAEYAEKLRNKEALIHKMAEEKKAMVEVKRGEEFLKTEDMANKYRATGQTPNKKLLC